MKLVIAALAASTCAVGAARAASAGPLEPVSVEAELGLSVMTNPGPCACGHMPLPLVAVGVEVRARAPFALAARGWLARGAYDYEHHGAILAARASGERWRVELGAGLIDVAFDSGDGHADGGQGLAALAGAGVAVSRGPAVSSWVSARVMRTWLEDDAGNTIGELAFGVSW